VHEAVTHRAYQHPWYLRILFKDVLWNLIGSLSYYNQILFNSLNGFCISIKCGKIHSSGEDSDLVNGFEDILNSFFPVSMRHGCTLS